MSGVAVMIFGGYADAIKSGDYTNILSADEIAPLKAHGLLATTMMILLVLHVAGVIKHYVLTKENTLKRILPK